MKKLLFLVILLCIEKALHAQQHPLLYTIRADSVKITNSCDTAELILENHTTTDNGYLAQFNGDIWNAGILVQQANVNIISTGGVYGDARVNIGSSNSLVSHATQRC